MDQQHPNMATLQSSTTHQFTLHINMQLNEVSEWVTCHCSRCEHNLCPPITLHGHYDNALVVAHQAHLCN